MKLSNFTPPHFLLISFFSAILISTTTFAQWQAPNNTNTVNLNPQNANRNVGIGTTNAAAKLHVVGNTWLNGITSMAGMVYQSDAITFTGSKLDFFTPVQAQYNGGKPILSLSQFGEINFFSSPYLNENAVYLGWSGDFNHGIRQSNNFGGASGFDGPVVFGQNGGALGSSTQNQNWTNNGTKVALSWNNENVVKIHKAIQFADGTLQTTAGQNVTYNSANNYYTYQGNVNIPNTLKIGTNSLYLSSLTSGENNIYSDNGALLLQSKSDVAYNQNTIINSGNTGRVGIGTANPQAKLHVSGDILVDGKLSVRDRIDIGRDDNDPLIRIGSLVMQDFSSYNYSGPSNGYSVNSTPESFVFGNIYFDEVQGKYRSIFNSDFYNPYKGGNRVYTNNGGTALRFDSENGALEFVSIPKETDTNGAGFSLTKQEMLNKRKMIVSDEGVKVNGNITTTGLVIPTNASLGKVLTSDATGNATWTSINQSQWLTTGNNIAYNGGNVGIGVTNNSLIDQKFVVDGNSKFMGNVGIGTAPKSDINLAVQHNLYLFDQGKEMGGLSADMINGGSKFTIFGTKRLADGTLQGGAAIELFPQTEAFDNRNGSINFWSSAFNNPNAEAKINFGSSIKDANGNVQYPTHMSISKTGQIAMGTFTPAVDTKLHVVGNTKIEGNVFIGTAPPTSNCKLGVDGNIRAKGIVAAYELVANATATPDFVFENSYSLPSLQSTKDFVKQHKHLPYIKSAKELEAQGINMTEHTNGILRHVEEMYLHIIKLEEEIKALKAP